jgi:hypothetical protein
MEFMYFKEAKAFERKIRKECQRRYAENACTGYLYYPYFSRENVSLLCRDIVLSDGMSLDGINFFRYRVMKKE